MANEQKYRVEYKPHGNILSKLLSKWELLSVSMGLNNVRQLFKEGDHRNIVRLEQGADATFVEVKATPYWNSEQWDDFNDRQTFLHREDPNEYLLYRITPKLGISLTDKVVQGGTSQK